MNVYIPWEDKLVRGDLVWVKTILPDIRNPEFYIVAEFRHIQGDRYVVKANDSYFGVLTVYHKRYKSFNKTLGYD